MSKRLPSPLDHREKLRARLAPPALIALDFDGTLTEIVDDPEAPALSPERREIVNRLVRSGRALAIISGRSLDDVRARVGIDRAYYAGNHGIELAGPGLSANPERTAGYAARLSRLLSELGAVEGSVVEDKGLTATVHIRPREDHALAAAVGEALRGPVERAGFVLREGKASWEIRPQDAATKGDALRRLLEATGSSAERTLYAGDDRTDEDVFRILQDGVTVLVGDPRWDTAARYGVPDPAALYDLLEALGP